MQAADLADETDGAGTEFGMGSGEQARSNRFGNGPYA